MLHAPEVTIQLNFRKIKGEKENQEAKLFQKKPGLQLNDLILITGIPNVQSKRRKG